MVSDQFSSDRWLLLLLLLLLQLDHIENKMSLTRNFIIDLLTANGNFAGAI